MLRFLLELIPCLLIGFWLGRRHPDWSARLARPLVRFGVPLSVMGLLLRGGLSDAVLEAAVVAPLVVGLWLLLVSVRPLGPCLESAALKLGSGVGNTAYVGVPLALAFLPEEALPITIGYDLGATLFTWSVGALWLAGRSVPSRSALQGLLQGVLSSPASRSSPLWQWTLAAVVAGALVARSRWCCWPVAGCLGPCLGRAFQDFGAEAGVARWGLLLFPLLLLVLGSLMPWDALMVQALVLQGATPTAISVLLIAESAERDQAEAASLVFWSTVLALVTASVWGQVLPRLVT